MHLPNRSNNHAKYEEQHCDGFHGLEDMQEVQGDIGEMQDMHMCTPAVKTQVTIVKDIFNLICIR